jgi:tetratricopeptide (TPR) repeat protein
MIFQIVEIPLIAEVIMTKDQSEQSSPETEFWAVARQARQLEIDKHYSEALDILSAFIKTHPQVSNAYFHRGHLYWVGGNLTNAIEDYTMCIELDPAAGGAFSARGSIYFKEGKFEEALHDFSRDIELSGGNSERTLYMRGKIYEQSDKIELAITDYINAFRLGVPDKVGIEIQRYIRKHKGEDYLFDYLKNVRDT